MKTWTVELMRMEGTKGSHLSRYERIEAQTENSATKKAEKTWNTAVQWVRSVRPETERPLTHEIRTGIGCLYGYYTSEEEAETAKKRLEGTFSKVEIRKTK